MPSLAADLPEELIHQIVDFLSGQYLSHFAEEAEHMPPEAPLKLTKKQLGSCSLACRHWAAYIRHKIFYELTLRSHEDARTLLGFASAPVSPRFGIAQHVQGLVLSIDLADAPWAYLIYTYRHLFPELEDGGIQLSVCVPKASSSPIERTLPAGISSIHHAVPRALPASLSISYGLLIENIHFAHAANLVSLLRSVHSPPADTQPRSFLTRLPAGYYKLRRVSFEAGPKSTPSPRLWIDALGVLDLYLAECPTPWTFLRPFVMTRDPAMRRAPPHAWVPHLRTDALEGAELVLEAAVRKNCGCTLSKVNAEGHDVFHLELQPGSGYARGPPDGFRTTLRSGCLRTCWHALELTASAGGVLREARVVLGEHMRFVPGAWAALDTAAAACGPDMRAFVVQLEDSVGPLAARELVRDIEGNMPLMREAGKLEFWRRVIKTRPLVYVEYDPEEEFDNAAGGDPGSPEPVLDILPRSHFYF
ncbi:hypothetical protein PsYK624_063350 [Phanerochaete sordida]|uniref:F-box domain-containing protein n=1 Tax=Phanerochaete sordida TaxID=48140 RepID=A0A9P3G9C2_9APHY|nr:hypothetical protein PsYK624_063350 [Phanerochaete sordida]